MIPKLFTTQFSYYMLYRLLDYWQSFFLIFDMYMSKLERCKYSSVTTQRYVIFLIFRVFTEYLRMEHGLWTILDIDVKTCMLKLSTFYVPSELVVYCKSNTCKNNSKRNMASTDFIILSKYDHLQQRY